MLFLGVGILTLNSCVYFKRDEIVKDEPHNSQWRARQEQQALAAAAANGYNVPAPTFENVPVTPQPAVQHTAPVQQATQTKQQATTAVAKTTTAITTQPAQVKEQVKPTVATTPIAPKIAVTAPVQPTAPAAPAAQPEKKITNLQDITNENGYIPTAKPVPGDPTRVYNPLAPEKTIRILDKNGNPHPAGTKLKVKGTNYMFYVP